MSIFHTNGISGHMKWLFLEKTVKILIMKNMILDLNQGIF